MDWQPIETAPKDERILVYTDREETALVEWYEGEWRAVVDECFAQFTQGDQLFDWVIDPTHWMPLPAPPVSAWPSGKLLSEETVNDILQKALKP